MERNKRRKSIFVDNRQIRNEKKGQWWGRKIDGNEKTNMKQKYMLHKIFLLAFQKEFMFSIYIKVLHHVTYE